MYDVEFRTGKNERISEWDANKNKDEKGKREKRDREYLSRMD